LIPEAIADIQTIAIKMNRQRAGRGDRFTDAVQRLTQRLLRHPQMYARVPRSPSGRDIREAVVRKFPYIMTYEVTATEIVILSVTHGHSKRKPWRRRLGPNP
jgi:plasmid stabilization system protein ParE